LADVVGCTGILLSSVLSGTIYITGNLQSRNTLLVSFPTYLNFALDPTATAQLEISAGYCQIQTLTKNNLVGLQMKSGSVTIDNTCTGGTVRVSGNAVIVDQSGGAVTIIDNTNATDITDRVWDEARAEHIATGTFGAVDEWAGNIDATSIANAVWNVAALNHDNDDTMGELQNQIDDLTASKPKVVPGG
jgi:hypothetical protein